MNTDALNEIANYILLAGSIPAVVFLLVYGFGSPWYNSGLGRVMFLLGFSIVLIFGVVLGSLFFGEYPGREWVRIIAYSLLTLALTLLAIIVIIERRTPASSLSRKENDHELTH